MQQAGVQKVRIEYDVRVGDEDLRRSLPFVVAVLGDFSNKVIVDPKDGHRVKFRDPSRKALRIGPRTFDAVMSAVGPEVDLAVENRIDKAPDEPDDGSRLKVQLVFRCLEDFHPDRIVLNVEPLRELMNRRESLVAEKKKLAGSRRQGQRPHVRLEERGGVANGGAGIQAVGTGSGSSAAAARQSSMAGPAASGMTAAADPVLELDAQIAEMDRRLVAQTDIILHHPVFQRLEASWRGVHYLVLRTLENPEIRIEIFDVSRKDLLNDFKSMVEFDQSGLFRKIYEDQFGTAGGEPYGLMIGDYEFTNHPEDTFLLEKISNVAAAAWCPFITSPSPAFFDLESWQDLGNPRDLARNFATPGYIKWREFRGSDDSRFVGLVLPRVLTRLPYGRATVPVASFDYEEDVTGENNGRYCWGSSAYAFGSRVVDAFDRFGWTVSILGIAGGGRVEGLPLHAFATDSEGIATKCAVEVSIDDRREHELARLGFIPLFHHKDRDFPVFFSAQSAQKPREYDLALASANAELSAQIPYILAASRFAHYLKAIQRDKLGSSKQESEVQRELSDWIMQYVIRDDNAPAELKARMPLRDARIEVAPIEGRPGCYDAVFWLQPHYQLREISVALRLVAHLDRPRAPDE